MSLPAEVIAEADAYAKIRFEAMRRADNSFNSRRQAFLEIAEFCDQQERLVLNSVSPDETRV